MTLYITESCVAEVRAHAHAERPHEAVGLLAAKSNATVTTTLRLRNIHPLPRFAYRADATDLNRALTYLSGLGLRFVGVYHSHPDTAADFSANDRQTARVGLLYLVIGGPSFADIRAYRRPTNEKTVTDCAVETIRNE